MKPILLYGPNAESVIANTFPPVTKTEPVNRTFGNLAWRVWPSLCLAACKVDSPKLLGKSLEAASKALAPSLVPLAWLEDERALNQLLGVYLPDIGQVHIVPCDHSLSLSAACSTLHLAFRVSRGLA